MTHTIAPPPGGSPHAPAGDDSISLGRRRLSHRRQRLAQVFEHKGHEFCVSVGPKDDGKTVGELFLDLLIAGKDTQTAKGTQMHAFTEDCATLISILLQSGWTVAELARRLTHDGVARRALLIAAGLPNGEFSQRRKP